jgi:hypothetical protein
MARAHDKGKIILPGIFMIEVSKELFIMSVTETIRNLIPDGDCDTMNRRNQVMANAAQ